MSERLLQLGVPPAFFAHARHFESVFRELGYTPAQIHAAIKWGAGFNGKPEDLMPQFERFCEQQNIDQTDADLAINWHAQVAEKGIDGMPQPAARIPSGDDHLRLQEIEEEMRKPRADSQYWKSAEMRDEYRELLERREGGGASTPVVAGKDSARRVEIEQVMRTDRARYHRSGMDKEYFEILQREAGETPQAEPLAEISTSTPT